MALPRISSKGGYRYGSARYKGEHCVGCEEYLVGKGESDTFCRSRQRGQSGGARLSFHRNYSLFLERRTRDRKVASSNPGRSSGRIFFSRVNFVCLLVFGVRSTAVLPQWHVKDPGYSAKSGGDRLHLNTHTPLTQRSRKEPTIPLCRHLVLEPIMKRSHT